MRHHRRSRLLAVGLAILGVLLACGLSALLGTRPSSAFSRAEELADARNRWLSRPVPHYRLVMQAPSWCRLDVEIESEQVVRVFENSCPSAPQTVTGMFEMIKQIDSAAGTIFLLQLAANAPRCAISQPATISSLAFHAASACGVSAKPTGPSYGGSSWRTVCRTA